MDGGHCCLSSCHQAWDDHLLTIYQFGGLGLVVSWDTSHVVVDSGYDGYWFFGNINVGEDLGGFRDAWESLVQDLGVEVVEVQVDVVFLRSNTSSFHDFHRFSTTHDVSRGQVES